jgi:hypothetical protein
MPLENCPICRGSGEVTWQFSSSVKPQEWECVGRYPPRNPNRKKGPLKIVETKLSKEQRKVWMEHVASFNGSCACVTQVRVDFTQLKRTAAQIQRIIHNEKPRQHDLDDDIDDLFN